MLERTTVDGTIWFKLACISNSNSSAMVVTHKEAGNFVRLSSVSSALSWKLRVSGWSCGSVPTLLKTSLADDCAIVVDARPVSAAAGTLADFAARCLRYLSGCCPRSCSLLVLQRSNNQYIIVVVHYIARINKNRPTSIRRRSDIQTHHRDRTDAHILTGTILRCTHSLPNFRFLGAMAIEVGCTR